MLVMSTLKKPLTNGVAFQKLHCSEYVGLCVQWKSLSENEVNFQKLPSSEEVKAKHPTHNWSFKVCDLQSWRQCSEICSPHDKTISRFTARIKKKSSGYITDFETVTIITFISKRLEIAMEKLTFSLILLFVAVGDEMGSMCFMARYYFCFESWFKLIGSQWVTVI